MLHISSVALIIIYNHKYDQNIEVLEELYKNRFSDIYHLVPFYTGSKANVIPVYENSFYFQGYIAQGLKFFYKSSYTHYFFVADDLVLNPIINEGNYCQHLNLRADDCFLPSFISLHNCNKDDGRWPRVTEALHYEPNKQPGIEVGSEMPEYSEALRLFERHGLIIEPFNYMQLVPPLNKPSWSAFSKLYQYYKQKNQILKNRSKSFNLHYPLVGGYSDIIVISQAVIKKFAHYCGIFASAKLFVELAIPTSMALAAETIILEKELQFRGKPLWTQEDFIILEKYDYILAKLLDDFPKDLLYLHPIKLSKWKK